MDTMTRQDGKRKEATTMASNFYSVQFLSTSTGSWELSRYFSTVRAARAWAQWLTSQNFIREVTILRGGPGGEPVAF